jgi:Ankyrin repeats (3 copies)
MLDATINGNFDTLQLLIERGISCSGMIDDSGLTLIHVAAAYGRLECLSLLMRQGYDAHAITNDGWSAIDTACSDDDIEALVRDGVQRSAWSERHAVAKMLLQHGVSYDNSTYHNDHQNAAMLAQCIDRRRDQTQQQQKLLSAHAASTYTMDDTNSDIRLADSTVKVQLINADTGASSPTVYSVDTTLLQQLHAVATEQTASTSILLNMIAPTAGWCTSTATATTTCYDKSTANYGTRTSNASIKLISYNGECAHMDLYCATLTRVRSSCACTYAEVV